MNRSYCISVVLLLWVVWSDAQAIIIERAGMDDAGTAYSTQQADVFSWFGNPASVSAVTVRKAGFASRRKYLLPELTTYELAVQLPVQGGGVGMRLHYTGVPFWGQRQAGLVYARKLGEIVKVGAEFTYTALKTSFSKSGHVLSGGVGILVRLNRQVTTGMFIRNPVGGQFNTAYTAKLPQEYTLGVGYDVSDNFFSAVQFYKTADSPAGIRASWQYWLVKNIMVRMLCSSEPLMWGFSSGFLLNDFRLDIQASFHQRLGISPAMAFSFPFSKTVK